jgi:hypothetical protein
VNKIANYYLQNDMKMIYDIISYHYFNDMILTILYHFFGKWYDMILYQKINDISNVWSNIDRYTWLAIWPIFSSLIWNCTIFAEFNGGNYWLFLRSMWIQIFVFQFLFSLCWHWKILYHWCTIISLYHFIEDSDIFISFFNGWYICDIISKLGPVRLFIS